MAKDYATSNPAAARNLHRSETESMSEADAHHREKPGGTEQNVRLLLSSLSSESFKIVQARFRNLTMNSCQSSIALENILADLVANALERPSCSTMYAELAKTLTFGNDLDLDAVSDEDVELPRQKRSGGVARSVFVQQALETFLAQEIQRLYDEGFGSNTASGHTENTQMHQEYLSIIQFVGELYLVGLTKLDVVIDLMHMLLPEVDEDSRPANQKLSVKIQKELEALCALVNRIGDRAISEGGQNFDTKLREYFAILQSISERKAVAPRLHEKMQHVLRKYGSSKPDATFRKPKQQESNLSVPSTRADAGFDSDSSSHYYDRVYDAVQQRSSPDRSSLIEKASIAKRQYENVDETMRREGDTDHDYENINTSNEEDQQSNFPNNHAAKGSKAMMRMQLNDRKRAWSSRQQLAEQNRVEHMRDSAKKACQTAAAFGAPPLPPSATFSSSSSSSAVQTASKNFYKTKKLQNGSASMQSINNMISDTSYVNDRSPLAASTPFEPMQNGSKKAARYHQKANLTPNSDATLTMTPLSRRFASALAVSPRTTVVNGSAANSLKPPKGAGRRSRWVENEAAVKNNANGINSSQYYADDEHIYEHLADDDEYDADSCSANIRDEYDESDAGAFPVHESNLSVPAAASEAADNSSSQLSTPRQSRSTLPKSLSLMSGFLRNNGEKRHRHNTLYANEQDDVEDEEDESWALDVRATPVRTQSTNDLLDTGRYYDEVDDSTSTFVVNKASKAAAAASAVSAGASRSPQHQNNAFFIAAPANKKQRSPSSPPNMSAGMSSAEKRVAMLRHKQEKRILQIQLQKQQRLLRAQHDSVGFTPLQAKCMLSPPLGAAVADSPSAVHVNNIMTQQLDQQQQRRQAHMQRQERIYAEYKQQQQLNNSDSGKSGTKTRPPSATLRIGSNKRPHSSTTKKAEVGAAVQNPVVTSSASSLGESHVAIEQNSTAANNVAAAADVADLTAAAAEVKSEIIDRPADEIPLTAAARRHDPPSRNVIAAASKFSDVTVTRGRPKTLSTHISNNSALPVLHSSNTITIKPRAAAATPQQTPSGPPPSASHFYNTSRTLLPSTSSATITIGPRQMLSTSSSMMSIKNGVNASFMTNNQPVLFKAPIQKTNRKLIELALTDRCLPGKVNDKARSAALAALKETDAQHFVILFRNKQCQYRGMYVLKVANPNGAAEVDELFKASGSGPPKIDNSMLECLYKYSSNKKEFDRIDTATTLSVQIDAVVIKDVFWRAHNNNSKAVAAAAFSGSNASVNGS